MWVVSRRVAVGLYASKMASASCAQDHKSVQCRGGHWCRTLNASESFEAYLGCSGVPPDIASDAELWSVRCVSVADVERACGLYCVHDEIVSAVMKQ